MGRWRTVHIAAVTAGSFLICCGFQFWAYSRPAEYLVAYDFPLMPLVTCFLFELIRRWAHYLKKLERPIVGLSHISLGIYFLHIIIMTTLTTLLAQSPAVFSPPIRLLILETVSLALSIVIILPLSKIGLFKRYLFLIK
jgi:membrane-bound acyltransferase YfiQ involved in biofilm formation